MYPKTVRLCENENYQLIAIEDSDLRINNPVEFVHAFLTSQHAQEEQAISKMTEVIGDSKEWSSVEICSCPTHVCALMKGSNCMAYALKNQFWTQLGSEVTSVDQEHIYIKLGMQ